MIAETLASQIKSSAVRAVIKHSRCRSIWREERLTLPTAVSSVGCFGKKLWLNLQERVLVISASSSTLISIANPKSHAALEIVTDAATVWVSDVRRFVNVALMYPHELRDSIGGARSALGELRAADIMTVSRAYDGVIADVIRAGDVIAGADQRLISEALFLARVSPWRRCADVSSAEWLSVCSAITAISHTSAEAFKSEVLVSGLPAAKRFPPECAVYGKRVTSSGRAVKRDVTPHGCTVWWSPDEQL